MNYHITTIPGDGIGPEIVKEACKVLNQAGQVFGHSFDFQEVLMGGCSIDAYGVPLTEEALETARNSDAVLLGAVGGDVGNSRWYWKILLKIKSPSLWQGAFVYAAFLDLNCALYNAR